MRDWTWLRQLRLADAPGTQGDAQDDLKLALERTLLPRYLSAARWYAAKDAGAPAVEIVDLMAMSTTPRSRSCRWRRRVAIPSDISCH